MLPAMVGIRILRVFSMLSLYLLYAAPMEAQSFLLADGEIQVIEALKENYQDFIVPKSDTFNLYNLEIEGADGGWIEYSYQDRFGTRRTRRINGGEGATISATYTIGRGMGEIAPGSILRFLLGNRGERAKFDLLPSGEYGAGGGGGSAVLLSKDSGVTWEILLVAAGGGGAGADASTGDEIDTEYNPGRPGSINDGSTSSKSILNKAMESGQRGSGGASNGNTGGGGGAFENGQHETGGLYYGNSGWADRKFSRLPLGGLGGTQAGCLNGGWGFGGGGSGGKGGGGGGGYSGGGAGAPGYGGEGGSSYVNTFTIFPRNVSKKQNGDTNNPKDGQARYQFAKRDY